MFFLSNCALQNFYLFYEPLKIPTIFLIFISFCYFKKRLYRQRVDHKIKKALLLYIFLTIIAAFVSTFQGVSCNQFYHLAKQHFFNYGFLFYSIYIIRERKDIELFNSYLYKFTIFICSYAVFEYLTHMNFVEVMVSIINPSKYSSSLTEGMYENARGVLNGRFGSTFVHPLNFGQYLVVILGYILLIPPKQKTNIWYFTIFFVFIGLVLSGSRSCIFPAIILFLVYIFFDNSTRKKNYILWFFIGVFAFSYINSNNELRRTIEGFFFIWDKDKQSNLNAGGSSVELREYQWETIKDIASQTSVLWGMGYGFISTKEFEDNSEGLFGIESILFTIVLEGGIVGFLLYVSFYWSICGIIQNKYKIINGRRSVMILFVFGAYFISLLLTGNRNTIVVFFTTMGVYYLTNAIRDVK